MWFADAPEDDRWHEAIAHLSKDRTLARIIERVGPCTLRPTLAKDHYTRLIQSILSQQVSVKAASAMYAKLAANFPRKRPTPALMIEFLTTGTDEAIRACGVSRQKKAYLHDLAQRFHDRTIDPKRFDRMTDDELIEQLTQVKGIGRWTVEMLLIFALNRADVWPVDDLGIRLSVQKHWPKKFPERPTPKAILNFADKWRPWRTVASWYLWRGYQPPAKPTPAATA